MKYIILLSVLLTACATTTLTKTPTKTPTTALTKTPALESPCYFLGGTYRLIAYLKKHNCSTTPLEKVYLKKVNLENQLCGVYYDESKSISNNFYTIAFVEQKKVSGIIFYLNPCSAIYSVEFVKEN